MAMNTQIEREIDHGAPQRPRKKSHAGFLILLFVIGAALAAGIVFELMQRKTQDKNLAATASEDATRAPSVNVGRVRIAPASSMIELPCQTLAMVETPIYARADGYIKQRPVDIGDRVKKGQLLFEIETPELESQVEQAKATLAQSKAGLQQLRANLLAVQSNLHLAEVTAQRWKNLTEKGVFAKQDLDEKLAALELGRANVKAAEENVNAAESTISANEANLKRLEEMKSFNRLVAPYDGVITFRSEHSDLGTLITAGNTSSSREIMRVAQIDTLRVFVSIPQTNAGVIRDGIPADLTFDEISGRVFHTSVAGITHSVDANSRTMLAVLLIKNPKEELLPGMYAKARFSLPHAVNVLMLPADALMLPTEGPRAAVVGEDHKVHFRQVTLGRDYGSEVEIQSGLNEGDLVVLSPNDSIREGVTVIPKELVR
jgi:RND family efflux transporter MFP subunit